MHFYVTKREFSYIKMHLAHVQLHKNAFSYTHV